MEPRIRPSVAVAFALLPVVLVGVSACVSDSAGRYYSDERYPEVDPTAVEVLRSEPQRPYIVIADFQARGADDDYMRKKAAAIGADAVIVSYLGGYRDRGDEWAGQDSQSQSYSRVTGTAIKYK